MGGTATAYGWRSRELDRSPGLDFLGLANPIERILDAWTPGITNATRRARYFSMVPWIHWKYATLGGSGTAADQRQFTLAMETLLAYVNVAHEVESGQAVPQIIRRRFAAKRWRKDEESVPLRGKGIPSSPSALDAALYGPSFVRLHLLGTHDRFRTCLPAGQEIAEAFEEAISGLPQRRELLFKSSVERSTVRAWSEKANLQTMSSRETTLLRALFFAYRPFESSDTLSRVQSLLLLLNMALTCEGPFDEWEVEVAFALGCDLAGQRMAVPECLDTVFNRWRIIALLKLLRHASELAFKSLHDHVKNESIRFPRLGVAADSLRRDFLDSYGDPGFLSLVQKHSRSKKHPLWRPDESQPAPHSNLAAAIELMAWCAARLRSDNGQTLLTQRVAQWGSNTSSDMTTYSEQLSELEKHSVSEVARWLLIDRGIARHNRVAASKLWQHDTFRLVEDEAGVLAIGDCPLPEISVRVHSMLSLLTDLKLLKTQDGGYMPSPQTQGFFDLQVQRDWPT